MSITEDRKQYKVRGGNYLVQTRETLLMPHKEFNPRSSHRLVGLCPFCGTPVWVRPRRYAGSEYLRDLSHCCDGILWLLKIKDYGFQARGDTDEEVIDEWQTKVLDKYNRSKKYAKHREYYGEGSVFDQTLYYYSGGEATDWDRIMAIPSITADDQIEYFILRNGV